MKEIILVIFGLIGSITSAIGLSPQIYANFKKKKIAIFPKLPYSINSLVALRGLLMEL